MRQSWTDDRLDEFGRRIDERFDRMDERFGDVDQRFRQVDERFDRLEAEMRSGFERVDRDIKGFGAETQGANQELRSEIKDGNRELRKDFDALRKENHALQMTMIRVGGAIIVALMGLVIAGQV